jgi:catechol 2,3-dioxygenase-like lactoylglutathione lyase family enzyme
MFSHIMIGTNDLGKAKAFYDALLGALDVAPAQVDRHRPVRRGRFTSH